jgi:hypothetical protein
LRQCDFGYTPEAYSVISAFQNNRTVLDLEIRDTSWLYENDIAECVSAVLQNMPQLQRFGCPDSVLDGHSTDGSYLHHVVLPALAAHRMLKELNLSECGIRRPADILLMADALAGNPTIEKLDISKNQLGSNTLPGITRILETTRLQLINLDQNNHLFVNARNYPYSALENEGDITQNFSRALSRNEFLKILNASEIVVFGETAALIFRALGQNTVLQCLRLAEGAYRPFPGQHVQGIGPLIESLPRMKGIKRLEWGGLVHCVENVEFLPALHRNSSIEELSYPDCWIIFRRKNDDNTALLAKKSAT